MSIVLHKTPPTYFLQYLRKGERGKKRGGEKKDFLISASRGGEKGRKNSNQALQQTIYSP